MSQIRLFSERANASDVPRVACRMARDVRPAGVAAKGELRPLGACASERFGLGTRQTAAELLSSAGGKLWRVPVTAGRRASIHHERHKQITCHKLRPCSRCGVTAHHQPAPWRGRESLDHGRAAPACVRRKLVDAACGPAGPAYDWRAISSSSTPYSSAERQSKTARHRRRRGKLQLPCAGERQPRPPRSHASSADDGSGGLRWLTSAPGRVRSSVV